MTVAAGPGSAARGARARAWVAWGLAAWGAAGGGCTSVRRRVGLWPMSTAPACVGETGSGVATHAVAWTGRGFTAVLGDGRALRARTFGAGLVPMGRAHTLGAELDPDRVSAASLPGGGALILAAAADGNALEVLRVDSDGRLNGDAAHVDAPGVGGLRAVARGTDDGEAVVLYTSLGRSYMRWLGPTGALGEAHACPSGVETRTAIAWGDGLAMLSFGTDNREADESWVRLVLTDAACGSTGGEAVGSANINGTLQSVLAVDDRLYVSFGDRDQRIWLAVHDGTGGVLLPARVVSRNATSPVLIPRREGIGLVQVRDNGVSQRLELLVFDTALVQQATRPVATAEYLHPRFVAPDPWGGALVGWEQPSVAAGVPGNGPARLDFFARICP